MFYGFDAPDAALRFVPPRGVVIDVGANLGEWAVPLAHAVGPKGRVLCCEPNPAVAAALAATLRINHLAQAEMFEVAISAAEGEGRLAIDPANSGQSRLGGAGIPVRLRSLDALVAETGLDRLDLLKIDVEGHEAAVLQGATQTLRELRPTLIFESGLETAVMRGAIAQRLETAAYDIVAVLHHYGALACDAADYRIARGACGGTEARNLLALPRRLTA